MLCEDAIEELYTSCLISKQNEGLLCKNGVGVFKCLSQYGRNSDRGNGSHNVSLPMILKRIKVSQMLRS